MKFPRGKLSSVLSGLLLVALSHSTGAQTGQPTEPKPQTIAPTTTPQPTQYFVTPPTPPQANPSHNLPAELLAILQSVFGKGRSSVVSQNCVTGREFACPGYESGPESYSPESFANARPTATSDLTTPFKILGPFKKYFDTCTSKAGLGSCKFINLGIKGDASHRARRSCHNSAQAIDVGPLTCSSGKKVLASDPLYFEVAKCMANDTNNELQVIFYKNEGPNMMQKSDHNNHMHIQLKNCSMVYG